MKIANKQRHRHICIEEEMAEKLSILAVMFEHFGWLKPRDHVQAARDEILKLLQGKNAE